MTKQITINTLYGTIIGLITITLLGTLVLALHDQQIIIENLGKELSSTRKELRALIIEEARYNADRVESKVTRTAAISHEGNSWATFICVALGVVIVGAGLFFVLGNTEALSDQIFKSTAALSDKMDTLPENICMGQQRIADAALNSNEAISKQIADSTSITAQGMLHIMNQVSSLTPPVSNEQVAEVAQSKWGDLLNAVVKEGSHSLSARPAASEEQIAELAAKWTENQK